MQFSRPLGDSELSYFLPSRDDGVNDMYLHLGFRAPPALVNASRVSTAWGILRGRHPLLAAHVVMKPGAYTDARFVYTAPDSPQAALDDAAANFGERTGTKDALIDAYLNGPRTLSPERISYLVLSSPSPRTQFTEQQEEEQEFDLLICAAHFLGDGMALHTFANDLFTLLAGGACDSDADLAALLHTEWSARWAAEDKEASADALPAALESRLPPALHAFQRLAYKLEFDAFQARLIGGHAFARAALPAARHTIVPTISFDPTTTKVALGVCKAHGVGIAHALFALCNIVWARTGGSKRPELPTLMYSALNLRPYLAPPPPSHPSASYWFLAVGYFNVILPAFLPRTPAHHALSFWARARSAKAQSTRAAKTPLLVPRTQCMAQERGVRARKFAALDDGNPAPPVQLPTPAPSPAPHALRPSRPPATALVGLSLLGNLDGMYMHAKYPRVELHTLTTGSRQRKGGMLLFGYTFKGRLWLSLGWDEGAFEKDEVQEWWEGVVGGVREFLVEGGKV